MGVKQDLEGKGNNLGKTCMRSSLLKAQICLDYDIFYCKINDYMESLLLRGLRMFFAVCKSEFHSLINNRDEQNSDQLLLEPVFVLCKWSNIAT